MAYCFSGVAKVLGVGSAQRCQLAMRGDASAASLDSCSTSASMPKAAPLRKRDVLRRKLFGGASESRYASRAPCMRKRDWIMEKLGLKNKADVLLQEAPQEEGNNCDAVQTESLLVDSQELGVLAR
eukprot:TRINITY_DN69460_c0_g1_i1.p1 TRINITY_DN69460_c0_g1~~TRINITY_DN69460_c0_g1_i1.p1  ORF type:complete len:145 (+),score=23.87 TRINITY_DN69460_c0_g1_i1:60-437(+)